MTIDLYSTKMRVNYYKELEVKKERQLVFSTVKELQKPVKSSKILKIVIEKLNQEIIKEVEELVNLGIISPDKTTKDNEIKKLQKKRIRDKRTYQRRLAELRSQGFLFFKNNHYTVSNMKYPEIKLWAEDFGMATLEFIMRQVHPQIYTLENNFQTLVKSFGVYIVYCFIEAIRPLTNNSDTDDGRQISLSANEKDNMTISWIKDAINIEELFYHFIALLKNQVNDDVARKNYDVTWKEKNGKMIVTNFSNTLNHLSHFTFLLKYELSKEENKSNLDSIEQESKFEFENKQIDMYKNILKNGFEMEYVQLEDAFRTLIVKNKEGVRPALPPLDKKYKWKTYFDRPEGSDDEKIS